MSVKVIFYIPLFVAGLLAGFFYFSHLWKSVNIFGTQKSKIMMSMVIRLPVPILVVLIGAYFAGIGGIVSVLLGFTTFQLFFLVKIGKKLKKDVEEEAKKQKGQIDGE